MADKYDSIYTGAQIDEAVGKAENAIIRIPCSITTSDGRVFLSVDMTVEQLRAACSQSGCVLHEDTLTGFNSIYFITSFSLSGGNLACMVCRAPMFNDYQTDAQSGILINNQTGTGCSGELFFNSVIGRPTSGWSEIDFDSVVQAKLNKDYEPFIVTLTPTAQDYSGTMNKTPEEISRAILENRRIIFYIPTMAAYVEATQFIGGSVACANITYAISGQDVLIQIVTSASDATYSTKIFPLTPMS